MYKARVRADGIASLVYWRGSRDGFDRTALFLNGMPYTPELNPFLREFLLDLGYGVVAPQYLGTFDSDGFFSPESAVETVFRSCNQLHYQPWFNLRGEHKFRVGAEVKLAIGHSFGTNILFSALLSGFRPPVMVLLSPYLLFGSARSKADAIVDAAQHMRHVRAALPHTFRLIPGQAWENFFYLAPQGPPDPADVPAGRKTKLVLITGEKDPGINSAQTQSYAYDMAARYPHAIATLDYFAVPHGTHDPETIMKEGIVLAIRKLCS